MMFDKVCGEFNEPFVNQMQWAASLLVNGCKVATPKVQVLAMRAITNFTRGK